MGALLPPYQAGFSFRALSSPLRRLEAKTQGKIWLGAHTQNEREVSRPFYLKVATLFGNLAIMTSGAGFRPITLRRQLSLTLPVRWSGNHGQQS